MLRDLILRWYRRYSHWEWSVIFIWVCVLSGIGIRGLIWPRIHNCYHRYYAAAGRHWLAGEKLYQGLGETCRYSPVVHALLSPFALLPQRWGALLWRQLNAAVYLSGLFCWSRAILPNTLTRSQRAAIFLLVLPLSITSLNNAQANPLMIGMLLLGVAAAGAGRWNGSAACVALACLVKVYPLALGLLLVLAFPRRFGARLGVALAAGLAVPFLMHNPDYVGRQYLHWGTNLWLDDRSQMPIEAGYRDLWLLCRLGHVPIRHHGYVGVQLAAAALLAGIGLAYRFQRWPRTRLLNGLLGLAACWMTLCGPATESCTYIVLAPTFAWWLVESWRGGYAAWVKGLVVGSYSLFLVQPFLQSLPFGSRYGAVALQPLGALILFATLLVLELRALFGNVSAGEAEASAAAIRAA